MFVSSRTLSGNTSLTLRRSLIHYTPFSPNLTHIRHSFSTSSITHQERFTKEKNTTNESRKKSTMASTNDSGRKYVPPFMRKQIMEGASAERPHQSRDDGYSNGNNNRRWEEDRGGYERRAPQGGYNDRGGYNNDRPRYDRGGGFGGPQKDTYTRQEENEEVLFKQTTVGINFDNLDNIPVETFGKNCPDPITSFDQVSHFPPLLLANIKRANFAKPTPVQKYSIPIIAAGRDLMACAQTGSGKTGGFLFPMITHLLTKGISQPTEDDMSGYTRKCVPSALVLAPTRELCTQIYDESRKFLYKTGLKSVCVYGGADIRYQIKQLGYGCEILVATPGRLVDLIDRGHVSLSGVKFLTLDEADRMLDMGFEQQIRYIVEKTGMPEAGSRSTLMFSATFPKNIQKLAQDFLHDYIFLTVGRVGSTTDDITQQFEFCDEYNKKDLLMQHVQRTNDGLCLIFTATKQNADELEDFFTHNGYRATSIHGDRSQRERESALKNFRKGQTPILVATDVASRGLDIPNVAHVINYDLPENIDDYVHRIGRTGRAGNKGLTTAFFTDKNRNIAADLVKLLRDAKQTVPAALLKANEEARLIKSEKKVKKPFARGSHPFGGGGRDGGYSGGGSGGNRGYGSRDGGYKSRNYDDY
jgi:ATP-dependent RNA helicase DDX3X